MFCFGANCTRNLHRGTAMYASNIEIDASHIENETDAEYIENERDAKYIENERDANHIEKRTPTTRKQKCKKQKEAEACQ